jgi:hypothetical protein
MISDFGFEISSNMKAEIASEGGLAENPSFDENKV